MKNPFRMLLLLVLAMAFWSGSQAWAQVMPPPPPPPSPGNPPGVMQGPMQGPMPGPLPQMPMAQDPIVSGPALCPIPEAPPTKVPVTVVPDPPAPVVSLKIRTPACAAPGANLEYHFFVENCSPVPAHHVLIRNPMPENARFVRASPDATNVSPKEIQWAIGTMRPGERREFVLYLAPIGFGDVQNCTRIQYEHGQCVTTRIAAFGPDGQPLFPRPGDPGYDGKGPDGKWPKGKEPPNVIQGNPKLRLTINGPAKQTVGLVTTYQLNVENIGGGLASDIGIETVLLGDDWEYVESSDKGVYLKPLVAWALDRPLGPGQSRSVELRLRVQRPGTHCFRASVKASPELTAQTPDACTLFVAPPSALLLEMYDRNDPIALGGDTSFPIIVHNQGSVTVTNLEVSAVIPDQMDFAKDPITPSGYQKRGKEEKTIVFGPINKLEPGKSVEFEVFTRGIRPGDARFLVQIGADQLREGGPVQETESTIIYSEDAPPPRFVMQSRRPRIILPLADMPKVD